MKGGVVMMAEAAVAERAEAVAADMVAQLAAEMARVAQLKEVAPEVVLEVVGAPMEGPLLPSGIPMAAMQGLAARSSSGLPSAPAAMVDWASRTRHSFRELRDHIEREVCDIYCGSLCVWRHSRRPRSAASRAYTVASQNSQCVWYSSRRRWDSGHAVCYSSRHSGDGPEVCVFKAYADER